MSHDVMDKIDQLFADGTLIDRVLQQAVQEAVLRHRKAGFPVSAWRDGKVVWIPPEEIPIPQPPDEQVKQ
jgi:hypothetical protein